MGVLMTRGKIEATKSSQGYHFIDVYKYKSSMYIIYIDLHLSISLALKIHVISPIIDDIDMRKSLSIYIYIRYIDIISDLVSFHSLKT